MPRGGSVHSGFSGGGFGASTGIAGRDEGGNPIQGQSLEEQVKSILVGMNAVPKKNKFQLAGDLQADASLAGADLESNFLQQAIQLLQGFEGFSPFATAGQDALAGLQEGSTVGGFGDRLNQIMSGGSFQGLVDERTDAVQGQLAAGGLTRSGTAIEESAAIPLDVALGLEGQITGRQAGLADLGLNAERSNFDIQSIIAQLLGRQGSIEAGGITNAAEAEASGILGQAAFQSQRDRDKNNNNNQLLGLGISALSAFSDPRLKENVRKEGKIGPLDLVRWDWIEGVKDTIVSKCNTFGFMSTQVKEFYPDCVGDFGGYDVVDYGKLIGRLKCHS